MTNTAPQVFDAHALAYEAQRRRLVPVFDVFYAGAVAALDVAGRPLERILDLGAGTGLLARRVLEARPGAAMTLLDGAAAMLEQARRVLGERATYVVGDLTDAPPPGPWDAVVSALAVHHLDDGEKRALFVRVHDELAPGGVFVNAEQVDAPSALLGEVYAAWHERRAREAGASDAEWAGAVDRMRLDRCATVASQLAWLREAGFPDADCLMKDHRFAVLVARRSG